MRPKVQNIGDLSAQAIDPEPTGGVGSGRECLGNRPRRSQPRQPIANTQARVASGFAKEFPFPQKGAPVAASPRVVAKARGGSKRGIHCDLNSGEVLDLLT